MADANAIGVVMGNLDQIKKYISKLDLRVEKNNEKDNIVIDKPWPFKDEYIPIKNGKTDQARQFVQGIKDKFQSGVEPSISDAEKAMEITDIDWNNV